MVCAIRFPVTAREEAAGNLRVRPKGGLNNVPFNDKPTSVLMHSYVATFRFFCKESSSILFCYA